MRITRRKGLIGLAAITFILLAVLWRSAGPPPEPEAPPEFVMQLLPSELHEVRRGLLRDTVQLTGSLVPGRELTISAEVSGRIETLEVREGQAVRRGDALVTLDIEALRNQLERQQATAEATLAQLNLARAQATRTSELVGRSVLSASALETETANVAQLEASYAALMKEVAAAGDDLDKARITAPFDGIISTRSVNPGAFVSPGAEMLELVDIGSLVLEGGIPVNYGPRLRPGQSVSIHVDGIPDRRFTGTIARIAPVAVQGTRVLPVYAEIDNPASILRGGMFATGELVLEEAANGIGIPRSAIRAENGTHVLLLLDGKLTRRDITVTRDWNRGRTAEIASGLQEGDIIVALPLERLTDGARVEQVGD